MNITKDIKLGGLLLLLGSIIILITIYLEFRIGWVGPSGPTPEEVPNFIRDNWNSGLKSIWTWQFAGHFLEALAFFHLAKMSRSIFVIPFRLLWAVHFIIAILILVAFGLTIGTYGPATEAYADSPSLFTTLRGGILQLYRGSGGIGSLIMLAIFIYEFASKDGVVPRKLGMVVSGLLVIAISMLLFKVFPGRTISLAYFLLPLTLGWCYFKYGSSTQEKS